MLVSKSETFKFFHRVHLSMDFKEKYTTEALKKSDDTGKEAKKEVLSPDTFAIGEILQDLKGTIMAAIRGSIR
jgi:ABC-type transport system involved in Fe-S cluster assembly fused permease/ATPase subunit